MESHGIGFLFLIQVNGKSLVCMSIFVGRILRLITLQAEQIKSNTIILAKGNFNTISIHLIDYRVFFFFAEDLIDYRVGHV